MSTSLYLYINGKKADAPDLKPFSYVGIWEITVTLELLILLIDRLTHSKAFVGYVFPKKAKLQNFSSETRNTTNLETLIKYSFLVKSISIKLYILYSKKKFAVKIKTTISN